MIKKIRAFINKHEVVVGTISLIIIILTTIFITTQLTGCQTYTDSAGQDVVKLTDGAAIVLDKGADLAPVVTDALIGVGVAVPAFAGLAGLLAGGISAFFGAYKKYRPQITREQNTAIQAGNMTKALVYAIEKFKESNTEDWEVLKLTIREQFADKVGPEALSVIETLLDEYRTDTLFDKI